MPNQRLCDLDSNNDLITGLPPTATPREHAERRNKYCKFLNSEMRKSCGFVMVYRVQPNSVHLSTDVNKATGRSGNGQSGYEAMLDFLSEDD